ncbi:MAG: hypothetical protein HC906_09660 [Bacteroidales bacterium]|nr:hypothetical protein [Bacteroidales bacterium]
MPTLNTVRDITSLQQTVGTFNLNDAANVFIMAGGTIRIYDACGIDGRAFDVLSSKANINVTGGTLELIPTTGTLLADAANLLIYSNAPINNLIINRASSSTGVQLFTYPLEVLRDLTITAGTLNANNLNVSIGRNFSLANGVTYTPGNNWTVFNGSASQSLSINTASALSFKKLKIDKPDGTVLTISGSQSTLNASDSVMILNGTLADGGKTINFTTSGTTITSYFYHSGLHTGAGKIVFADDDPQIIDGDGTGIFQNIELNNTDASTAPVSLKANLTINGTLTFSQDKLLNIDTYNLRLNASADIVNSGAARYIQTKGGAGDGGLTLVYPSPTTLTFPVGASSTSHALPQYTPASIGITGSPTALGSITVIPVGYEHPATTTNGRSLTYFWKVKSSGFVLGSATVTHKYTYSQSDVITDVGITENEYVAARYNPSAYTWTKGDANDVDEGNNVIGEPGAGNFLENTTFIDGDYTAGDDNPTNPFGVPTKYYSRQTGNWNSVNTWSNTGHTGAAASSTPGINDVVIIGGNDSVYLSTHNTNINTGVQNCASLQIERGSALDIGYNPACNFGIVQSHPNGNGNFRLTTTYNSGNYFTFPSGDFSDFNVNLGTTEIYSTNTAAGTTYWLPNNVTSYGNLIISPAGGSNIIFGNTDITVYGNCIIRGTNPRSWFLPTWDGNYPGGIARISKTITIKGYMDIQGGAFGWYGNNGGGAQNVITPR